MPGVSLRDVSAIIADMTGPLDLPPDSGATPGFSTPSAQAWAKGGAAPSYFYATCSADLPMRAMVVKDQGDGVLPASALIGKSVIGAVVDKPSPTYCRVQSMGMVSGFSGLKVGEAYLLGLNGAIYPAPIDPLLPYVHRLGMAVAANTLYLLPSRQPYKREMPAQ